ncbi:cysteine-rich repeat secretory protein 9-like [Raphanus sativus]|uniref:Cysteine-rich repeat secretory protein 9-like n=1 Tax=Raphanus sativus TaxID=3726 RepID=A0A9W3CUW9_RAPSA|nr:cysteine-rich repeat secretory protein 9-like [Raphanus sativus]
MARIIITLSTPLFFFFLFSLLSHQTMSQPEHLTTFCNPSDNFTQTSSYEANRDLLLSSLRVSSSLGTYSNATVGRSPNTVHGMFLCRGDTTAASCSDCVQTATIEISTNCTLNKEAVIYYEECMVRYSNVSFFSVLEVRPSIVLYSLRSAPNSNTLNETLADKFNQLILNVSSSSLVPYFVEDQELVTQAEGSYKFESMVQCSPGLDRFNCTVCLRFALLRVSTCCGSPSSALIFTPKCLLRYQTSVLSSPPPLPPSSPPPLSLPPPPPSPALFLPPPGLSQPPPPPLVFTRPQSSGSFSNVIKGNQIFGRIAMTMAVLVFALVNL